MKILVISATFPPALDGEAEHGSQIAARMAAQGHECAVLTTRRVGLVAPVGVSLLPEMQAWRWRELPTLASVLRRWRPDGVVLIFTARLFGEHPMITFLPSLLQLLLPRARLLTLVEIERAPYVKGFAARLGRKVLERFVGSQGVHWGYGTLLRDSHVVAALGPSILDALTAQDASLKARGLVVPPPPLIAPPADAGTESRLQSRQRLRVEQGCFLFAYFGFVYPGKGVETLFEALAILHGSGRMVRLVMAGGGRGGTHAQAHGEHATYEIGLIDRAKRLGIEACIEWPSGHANDTGAIARDLLAADAAVLPFDDGAELRRSSIAVAAAMGLPIITSQPSSAEQAFVHEGNVLLFPPQEPSALALAMVRLIDEPALRASLADGARNLHHEWFSWERAIASITEGLKRTSG